MAKHDIEIETKLSEVLAATELPAVPPPQAPETYGEPTPASVEVANAIATSCEDAISQMYRSVENAEKVAANLRANADKFAVNLRGYSNWFMSQLADHINYCTETADLNEKQAKAFEDKIKFPRADANGSDK